jgi:hypothetical protein
MPAAFLEMSAILPDLELLLGRVLINAQIAALLVAEFVHKSAGLSKKQQLTRLFCKRHARSGCGGLS